MTHNLAKQHVQKDGLKLKKLKFNFIEYGIIKPFSQTMITLIKPVILLSLIISIFTITVLVYVVVNVLNTFITFHFTIFSRVNTLTWVIYKNCIKTQKFISLSLNVRRSFNMKPFFTFCVAQKPNSMSIDYRDMFLLLQLKSQIS